jgi:hypothetical protein
MKFYLVAQFEIAYLKNNKGDIVRKYFAPKDQFFIPGVWDFEEFPKDFYLKTISIEEFKQFLKDNESMI